jgi:uncharacterized protein
MIFVDTSFWVALIHCRDSWHEQATALLGAHAGDRLVTTDDVRGEMWTFLGRRAGHKAAVRFVDAIAASPRVRLARVTEQLDADALAWLRNHSEREYSWVDATSFATMTHLRIHNAFAFDSDFTSAGFVELRA